MVTALILAGGKARRLGGIAKHEIEVEGRTIFERQVAVLAPRVEEILVATSHDIAGYRCVRDVLPDVGPLAGIAAGMAAMMTPWLLVVAGDMPYLAPSVVDLLLSRASESEDAVAFRIGGLPEPLVCMLHARAQPAVDRRIENGRYKVAGLFTEERLHVTWIEERELRAVDPDLRSLSNINHPSDLRRPGVE